MVSVHASSAVDRGFIGGVMVSVHASSAVDRGFIGGVMVSVHASSAVDRGFELRLGQNQRLYWYLLLLRYHTEIAKTGRFGIRIMFPSGATYLSRNVASVS